ncbi:hypothetical protein L596_007538 [Steinernema carpocapsae]|uniref:Uncharacterized protein n=1 Tax=Steinernema carpocapsae TaxID=34508 RepID=A0A4U5PA94_STECR|nr:hypothetical protein L596_007538 [Steinernema carpocapsae]
MGRKTDVLDSLKKKLKKAQRNGDTDEELSLKLEIAAELYEAVEFEEAQVFLNSVVSDGMRLKKYVDVAQAHRILANIASDEENYEAAVICIQEYLKIADKISRVDYKQLGYHELCRFHLDWTTVEGTEKYPLLLKANMYGQKSLDVLVRHSQEISSNRDAIRNGATVTRRKAGLLQLRTLIYTRLGQFEKAKKEIEFCLREPIDDQWKEDKEFIYKCLDAYLGCCIEPNERLRIAKKLVDVSKKCTKAIQSEAKLTLAKEYILSAQYGRAILELYEMRSTKYYCTESIENLLEFAYVAMRREESIQQAVSDFAKFSIFEKLGDAAHELQLRHVELRFYKMMLSVSGKMSLEEHMLALQSTAESFYDLYRFEEAREHYERQCNLEIQTNRPESKIIETKIIIYRCSLNSGSVGLHETLSEFEKIYKLKLWNSARRGLLEGIITVLELLEDDSEIDACLQKYSADLRKLADKPDESGGSDSEEYQESHREEFLDEFDKWSKEKLTRTALDYASDLFEQSEEDKYFAELKSSVDKHVNAKGETALHLVARADKDPRYSRVSCQQLLAMGYNPNVRDNGGWTPLLEAISEGLVENVRVLLEYGADVNARSHEGLTEAKNRECLSPLEDACDVGNVAIAKLLLLKNAKVTLKAIEYLNKYCAENINSLTEQELDELESLLNRLKARAPAKGSREGQPSQSQIRSSRSPSPVRHQTTQNAKYRSENRISDGARNLVLYEKTMRKVGNGYQSRRMAEGVDMDDDELEKADCKYGLRSPLREISPLRLDDDILALSLKSSAVRRPSSPPISVISGRSSHSHGSLNDREHDVYDIFRPPSASRKRVPTDKSYASPDTKRPCRAAKCSPSGSSVSSGRNSLITNSVSASNAMNPLLPGFLNDAMQHSPATNRTGLSRGAERSSQGARNSRPASYRILFVFEDDKKRVVLPERTIPISGKKNISHLRSSCAKLLISDKYESFLLKYLNVELCDQDTISEAFRTCVSPTVICVVSGWRIPQLSVMYNRLHPAHNQRQKVYRKLLDSEIGELNFAGCYMLTKNDIFNILEFVKKYSSLSVQTVNFQGIPLNADLLNEVSDSFCSRLAHLNISSCSLSDIMVKSMCERRREDGFKELAELNLRGNAFSSRQVEALLKECEELGTLDISLIPFQDDIHVRCESLGRAIGACRYLTTLRMRSCGNVDHILRGITESEYGLKSLQRLDLSCTSIDSITELLKKAPNLQNLNISDCEHLEVSEDDLKAILASKIERIDMSGCRVITDKWESFVQGRSRKGRPLHLLANDTEIRASNFEEDDEDDDPDLLALASAL